VDDARRTTAMWTMAVDAVTAEVASALEDAGVDSILLKGPSVAGWLYDDPAERPYVDSDLLVDPTKLATAAATLERHGFHRGFGPLPHPGMRAAPSYPWHRGESAVDLHETLPGSTADRRVVWAVLSAGREWQTVGGRAVPVLSRPARLAHLALHASHHGPRVERPIADLRRALERASPEEWHAATKVADAIGAAAAFARGLALTPDGARLLPELGLEGRWSVEALLDADGVPLAAGLERLSATRGLRARSAVLRDELLPSAEFMRWWSPLARRSSRGLAASYPRRWLYLAARLPSALRAWQRARAAVKRG
jgi:hypothetical protein